MTQPRNMQTRRFDDNIVVPEPPSESSFALEIGVHKMIALVITKVQARIIIQVTEPIIIGRSFTEDETISFIDLHPFGAEDLGVSRKHLRLWSENEELFIEDLGSTNGTRFNTVRLPESTPQRIRHADQIALAGLELKVEFIYDLLA